MAAITNDHKLDGLRWEMYSFTVLEAKVWNHSVDRVPCLSPSFWWWLMVAGFPWLCTCLPAASASTLTRLPRPGPLCLQWWSPFYALLLPIRTPELLDYGPTLFHFILANYVCSDSIFKLGAGIRTSAYFCRTLSAQNYVLNHYSVVNGLLCHFQTFPVASENPYTCM